MPTVFISHSSEDAQFIEREIIPLLASRGIEAWYSPEAIRTAEEWERAIKRGLESSDWFLVALSPRSARSKWVRAETGWAFANREGRIIPVIIEACDPYELHIRLNDLQFADFRREPRKGAERLLAVLGGASDPPPPQEPTADNTPLKMYANALMLKGDFDGAVAELGGAIELSPGDSGAYVLRGTCHLGRSDWDAAIADFTRAIGGKLNPLALSWAYVHRARAHAAKKDSPRALADCNEAVRADPNNADAYLLRGTLQRMNLERDAAIADFTEAIRLAPTSSEAFVQRHHAFREIGDTARARADYSEAIRLNPEIALTTPPPPSSPDPRIEEALRSLQAVAFLTQMDAMTPAGKQKALMELMPIGFPKVWDDLDYLIENLPENRPEHRLAVLLEEVAREAGLKK